MLTEMRHAHTDVETEINLETDVGRAVLHSLQLRIISAQLIDLDTALKGPALVAQHLTKKLHGDRSKPDKPYRLNAEQLECTSLFVAAKDNAFIKKKTMLHQLVSLK